MHLKLSTYAESKHNYQVDSEVYPCQFRYDRNLIKRSRVESENERDYHEREVEQHRTRHCLRPLEYIFKFHFIDYKVINASHLYVNSTTIKF